MQSENQMEIISDANFIHQQLSSEIETLPLVAEREWQSIHGVASNARKQKVDVCIIRRRCISKPTKGTMMPDEPCDHLKGLKFNLIEMRIGFKWH
jgi:hypothetical protein